MKNELIMNVTITGLKDLDREIIMKLDNPNILKCCKINKYFREVICDENFFSMVCKRMDLNYPPKTEDKTWKQYFIEITEYLELCRKIYLKNKN